MTKTEVFKRIHPGGEPYDYQLKWVLDKEKFKLGVKARQIGITTSEACMDFLDCLAWQESEKETNPPVIVFCSPSMRQSARLMHYIQRVRSNYEKIYKSEISFKKEREDFLQFDNGAEIFSLPNNPRTIEGIDASKGVIDEFGNFVGQEDREIYESLMGSLGAKGGGITVFGKPRGRRGLFYSLFDPHGEFSGQFSTHILDWQVRAKCDDKYRKTVEDQRKRMTSLAFREHYCCEFIDEQIVIFSYDILDRHTEDYPLWTDESGRESTDEVYMGIDFGKKISQTVVTIVLKDKEKIKVKYIKATNKPFEYQIAWISQLITRFKPFRCRIDKTGIGQTLEEKLVSVFGEHVIEGIQFTAQTKEKLIFNTLRLFEENRLVIPNHPELKDQLHGIEKEFTEQGGVRYTGKRTETDWKDDHAWSLFLACYDIDQSNWQMAIVNSETTKTVKTPDQVAEIFREQDRKKWAGMEDEDED